MVDMVITHIGTAGLITDILGPTHITASFIAPDMDIGIVRTTGVMAGGFTTRAHITGTNLETI